MKTKLKITAVLVVISMILSMMVPITSNAITAIDNGKMKVYPSSGGIEFSGLDELKGFDIQGYVDSNLISSTFGNRGYHTFLNVNGLSGEMDSAITDVTDGQTWKEKAQSMLYTEVDGEGWQTINGIKIKVSTKFINNGEQLQIEYELKNTTDLTATISLATTADVQIDSDDSATIERLEDGSGVRLWTKKGRTKQPVQFVFYGKGVTGTTAIDNLWIGRWRASGQDGDYMKNMFTSNNDVEKIENRDSAFTYSWVNRTITAGETQKYTVLMEVGKINIPNTGITLENNTKFYYKDVKINGTVTDKDLKDKITIHYIVDGTEYTLPAISTTGVTDNFTLDLTTLNLAAVTPHTLKVWATDSTNCDSNVEERTFTITYLKEPEVTLSTEDWAKNVTFRITDTENEARWVNKYQYRLNSGEWTDCEKDTDIPITENGNVKVEVRITGTQTDDYSNIVIVNAKVDKVNPTTTEPSVVKTTCSITLNLGQVDIHSGINTEETKYAICKDGEWSEWQDSNSFTGLTHNTEYKVKTKAVDKVGNTSESEELTVKTDELLVGRLILKLNNASGANYTEDTWTNQNIYVAIEERSVGATTKYKSVEGSAQTIAETNQETTVTTDDTTGITLSVTDGTNTVTSDVEHILKIDKVVPVINELSLNSDDWTKDSKEVTGKAIDNLSGIVAYQFSDKEDLTSESTGWTDVTMTTVEMAQTKEITANGKIYFYVKDAAGNIASVGIDTKIDSQGPVINFSRANGKTAINVTDTGAGIKNVKYAWTTENVEPTQWEDYSTDVTYPGTSMDKIYLWAKATDNLENITVESTVFSALKKPSVVSENEFKNNKLTFKVTSETEDSDVLYQFKVNDGEWQSITKDSNYTLTDVTDKTVKISTRILDNAGRYSEVALKTHTAAQGADNTTANGSIPQTGEGSFVIIFAAVAFIGVSLFFYKKLAFYKDIK